MFAFFQGADLSVVTERGRNALHLASQGGDVRTLKMLLDKGFNITQKSNGGLTPLLLAAMTGQVVALKFLMSKGTNLL